MTFKVAEPKFTTPPSKMDMVIIYNDYFLDYTVADSKKFLIIYLKENNRDKEAFQISKVDDWKIGSIGFTARMLSRGCVMPENEIVYMENSIKSFCDLPTEESEKIIKEIELTPAMEKAIIDFMIAEV